MFRTPILAGRGVDLASLAFEALPTTAAHFRLPPISAGCVPLRKAEAAVLTITWVTWIKARFQFAVASLSFLKGEPFPAPIL